MKMTSEQLKGMKHYLLSSLPDTPPLTTFCEQLKKGNEEMISISSPPFSYPLSTPLFHAQCFIHRIFRGLIEHQGETAYKFRRYRGKIGGAGNGEDDFFGAAV